MPVSRGWDLAEGTRARSSWTWSPTKALLGAAGFAAVVTGALQYVLVALTWPEPPAPLAPDAPRLVQDIFATRSAEWYQHLTRAEAARRLAPPMALFLIPVYMVVHNRARPGDERLSSFDRWKAGAVSVALGGTTAWAVSSPGGDPVAACRLTGLWGVALDQTLAEECAAWFVLPWLLAVFDPLLWLFGAISISVGVVSVWWLLPHRRPDPLEDGS